MHCRTNILIGIEWSTFPVNGIYRNMSALEDAQDVKAEHVQAHWMLIAAVAPAFTQWVLAMLIARQLGVVDLGMWVFANAVATPIVMILQLPLRTLFVVHKDSFPNFGDYFALRVTTLLVAMVIILAIGFATSGGYAPFAVVAALAVARCSESISDILYAPLQRQGELSSIATLSAWRAGLVLVLASAALNYTGSIALAAVAIAVSNLASNVLLEWPTLRSLAPSSILAWRRSPVFCYRLMVQAAPLSVAQALSTLAGNAPRYVVQWTVGVQALGMYAVLEHFLMPVSLVANAAGQASSAKMAREWHSGRVRHFQKYAIGLLSVNATIGFLVMTCSAVAGHEIISRVYGPDFSSASHWLLLMTVCGCVTALASATGYIMTSASVHRQQVPMLAATLLLSLAGGYMAVSWFGWAGAIIGAMTGSLFQFGASTLLIVHAVTKKTVPGQ